MTTRRQYVHKLAVAAAFSGVVGLAAGCGGSSKSAPPASDGTTSSSSIASATSSSPTSAPSTPDPTATADTEALGVYKNMISALTAAMDTNKIDDTLQKSASGTAFVTFTQEIASNINHNIIYVGAPQSSPKITATDLAANPKVIAIADCFGGPKFTPTFWHDDQAGHKAGQSAVGPGQTVVPHPLTAQVVNRNGTWLVEEFKPNGSATC